MKRWVVEPGSHVVVDDVVHAMGQTLEALDDGRVFVGRTRARRGMPVSAGDVVTVHASARASADVEILYEKGGIVAALKPAGIPTIADHAGRTGTLLSLVARAVHLPESRVHPTSRLDNEVSGVVVFATSDAAREHLARARTDGRYSRRYVALTLAQSLPEQGTWTWPIGRAKDPRLRMVGGRDGTHAETRFRVVARAPGGVLLAVMPITGRTHQIRVHSSHAGAPLLGDRSYGGQGRVVSPKGSVTLVSRIALHCARVELPEMSGRGTLTLSAPIPDELRALWRSLGGDDDAWDLALS